MFFVLHLFLSPFHIIKKIYRKAVCLNKCFEEKVLNFKDNFLFYLVFCFSLGSWQMYNFLFLVLSLSF